MGVSKVVYGDDTLVDLTGDTVTPTSLTLGATAHAANGEPIVGEYQYVLPPMSSDIRGGARIQPDSGLEITDTDNLQVRLALESDGTVRGGIVELTAKGHAEQDGTPTPDNPVPIQVVRGRNLFDKDNATILNAYINAYIGNGPIMSDSSNRTVVIPVKPNTTYTLQGSLVAISSDAEDYQFAQYESEPTYGSTCISGTLFQTTSRTLLRTFTTEPTANYIAVKIANTAKTDPTATLATIQLTLGSMPQPYVPYGHVGMEVRNPDTDELISCTALPLPQRGWVAGLPDGTADSLRLDGAGKVEWTLPTSKTTGEELASNVYTWTKSSSFAGGYYISMWTGDNSIPGSTNHLQTHLVTASSQAEYLVGTCLFDNSLNLRVDNDTYPTIESFKQWLASSGFELLYPLATPVTEDCGYCENWPTDIPDSATISIPELDAVGVKYFVDSAVTELARQWYARANSEYADRITALEQAVAELATS